jgi:hypothetical protein
VLISQEFGLVRRHESNDVILYAPLDEIQLRHGRLNFLTCSRDGVRNLLGATKRVEQLFTIAQERTLIGRVHREHLPIFRRVRRVIFLRVVCDEPL